MLSIVGPWICKEANHDSRPLYSGISGLYTLLPLYLSLRTAGLLCGKDHYSGQDYENLSQWTIGRLAILAEVFAIDLCAYAVMSNHYHLVLRINQKKAMSWTEQDVAEL